MVLTFLFVHHVDMRSINNQREAILLREFTFQVMIVNFLKKV